MHNVFLPTVLRDKDSLWYLAYKVLSLSNLEEIDAAENEGEVSNYTSNSLDHAFSLVCDLFEREVDHLEGLKYRLEQLKEKIEKQKVNVEKIESYLLENRDKLPENLKVSIRNNKELLIEDETLIPLEFYENKKVLDKTKLKKAIESGLEIKGVSIEFKAAEKVKVSYDKKRY